MLRVLLWLGLSLPTCPGAAQPNPPTAIGEWRSHLAYRPVTDAVVAGESLLVGSANGLFRVNPATEAVRPFSTLDGLTKLDISALEWDAQRGQLYVLHDDGTMDVTDPGLNTVEPYRDIVRSDLAGNLTINAIAFGDGLHYLAFGQGILEYDPERNETGDAYQDIVPGDDQTVNDVAIFRDSLFAATENGTLVASLAPGVVRRNPAVWAQKPDQGIFQLENYQGELLGISGDDLWIWRNGRWQVYPQGDLASFSGRLQALERRNDELVVSARFAVYAFRGPNERRVLFQGNLQKGVLDNRGTPWVLANEVFNRVIADTLRPVMPNGPIRKDAFNLNAQPGRILSAAGGVNIPLVASFSPAGLDVFEANEWQNYPATATALGAEEPAFDFTRAVPDPNEARTVWLGTFTRGIVRLPLDSPRQATVFTEENSTVSLVIPAANPGPGGFRCDFYPFDCPQFYHRVKEVAFDQRGVLWGGNFDTPEPLVARLPDGTWLDFGLGGPNRLLELLIDDFGQVWALVLQDGLVVYNPGDTLESPADDRVQQLRSGEGNGNLPSVNVQSIARDRDGAIWVGTDDGVAVFFSRNLATGDRILDAQEVLLADDDFVGRLLEGQNVNNIAVDGANRKWFATNSGAWLTNPEGDGVIRRFTTENSPLPVDEIRDIAVEPRSGEVFISTLEGMFSYRGQATTGSKGGREPLVFPNPVRPNYNGPIAVRNLTADAQVKVVDAAGRLVFEGEATGGQFIWFGDDLEGRKVDSGVYLFLISDQSGERTATAKVMIVR